MENSINGTEKYNCLKNISEKVVQHIKVLFVIRKEEISRIVFWIRKTDNEKIYHFVN
jgi:hypothetical protein